MTPNAIDKAIAALEELADQKFDWSSDCGGQLPYDEWVLHKAQQALTELKASRLAGGARDGYVMVPREPTEEMIKAGADYGLKSAVTSWPAHAAGYYKAMLAAAPSSGESGE